MVKYTGSPNMMCAQPRPGRASGPAQGQWKTGSPGPQDFCGGPFLRMVIISARAIQDPGHSRLISSCCFMIISRHWQEIENRWQPKMVANQPPSRGPPLASPGLGGISRRRCNRGFSLSPARARCGTALKSNLKPRATCFRRHHCTDGDTPHCFIANGSTPTMN